MSVAVKEILITPPAVTRTRESSADAELVAAMSQGVKEGQYVTDGEVHKTYTDAGNASQVYRRALAKALGIEPHKIVSKTWGTDAKGVLLTDREKPGQWRFALTVDHSRAKRTRKQNGATS